MQRLDFTEPFLLFSSNHIFCADMDIDWIFVISCLMLAVWCIVMFLYATALIYAKVHLHRKLKPGIDKSSLPGVSIAKPLCSADDPNLEENLTSYFELDYPKYELLFCIQDKGDLELIKIVDELICKYPHVDARLFIGAKELFVNPKVNNMINAYENAKHPLFMISDANIKMKPEALSDMVSHMTEKVGLVHQVPIMCDGDLSFSRRVEQLWFGGAHARVYVSANALGINCMTSMSCMFQKKILDELGGLQKLGGYLGEDFYLGQMIQSQGWKIVLCSQPALQNSGISSVKSFQTRMKRWMYLRFTEMPYLLLLEPVQEHVLLGPLTSLAVCYLFCFPPYLFLLLHFTLCILADYFLLSALQNKKPAFSLPTYVVGWFFRELSPLYMIPSVMSTRSVVWAGKKFIVHYGGRTERVND